MATIFCKATATGSNDGTSWEDAYTSLQTAGEASTSSGDEVWVSEGTFTLTATLEIDNANDPDFFGGFSSALTGTSGSVAGRTPGTYTTLDGGDVYRCVFTSGWEGTIDGFKLLDGVDSAAGGGGIYVTTAGATSITISNCEFSGCNATGSFKDGGGLFFSSNSSADCTVDSCVFDTNTATGRGGAIGTTQTGDMLASLTISDCEFNNNTAANRGGAVVSYATETTYTNCKFDGNTATGTEGGHIYMILGLTTTTINCVFSNGSASKGGAVYGGFNSDLTATNCTFADNSCTTASGGGAVNCENTGETFTATNCIFWGNEANSVANQIATSGGSVTVTYSNVEGSYTGTGNVNDDPNFKGSGADPYDLSTTSDAVDSGNAGATDYPSTDILGRARYDDPDTTTTGTGTPAYSDMGAYEMQAQPTFFGSLLLANN